MMELNKGVEEARYQATFPVRGTILETRYASVGGIRRTLVDCYVADRVDATMHEYLIGVPLLYTKMNKHNGEEWTPEKGDMVAIGFFNGNRRDPFVMGYLGGADTDIYTPTDITPRYYRKRSGTIEQVDQDGNRYTYIFKDDTLVVEGIQNIHIKGTTGAPALTVLVDGVADVTVTESATVTCPHVTVTASTKVDFVTPEVTISGKLTVVGNIKSTNGKVGDSVRDMSDDRAIFNTHTHNETNSVTNAPNQQQ